MEALTPYFDGDGPMNHVLVAAREITNRILEPSRVNIPVKPVVDAYYFADGKWKKSAIDELLTDVTYRLRYSPYPIAITGMEMRLEIIDTDVNSNTTRFRWNLERTLT